MMSECLRTLTRAGRYICKHWLTSAAIVFTLAISIGFGVAVYDIAKNTILKKLPIPNVDQLVMVQQKSMTSKRFRFTLDEFEEFRRSAGGRAEVSAYVNAECFLGDGLSEQRIRIALVAVDYFKVLQATPTVGSLFSASDNAAGSARIAVLSYAFWQREYRSDPRARGATIRVNKQPFTIVGVAHPSFVGLEPTRPPDVYIPLNMKAFVAPLPSAMLQGSSSLSLFVFARVVGENRQSLAALWSNAIRDRGGVQVNRGDPVAFLNAESGNPFYEEDIREMIVALAWAGGVVLLVAFIAAAGLVLALEIAERPVMGMQMALGATFSDMARTWLLRMLILATASSAGAYVIAVVVGSFIVRRYAATSPSVHAAGLDLGWTAFLICVGACIVMVTMICALVGMESRRRNLIALVHDSSNRAGIESFRFSSILVVGQVTLAAILFVFGCVVLRYWSAIENRDLGFRPAGLANVEVELDLRAVGGGPGSGEAVLKQLRDHLAGAPGMLGVSVSRYPLFSGSGLYFPPHPLGSRLSPKDEPTLFCNWVGPSWFKTIGARMVAGREFTERDGYFAPPVAIVTEAYARKVWPGESALGKRMITEPFHGNVEVVGVVRDYLPLPSLEYDSALCLFIPLLQIDESAVTLTLRDEGDGRAALAAAKTRLREFGSMAKATRADTLENGLSRVLWKQRLYGGFVKAIVVLALSLAVVGVYANMRRVLLSRRREMAIRMALGANLRQMMKPELRISFGMVSVGTLIGAVIAVMGTRVLNSSMPTHRWTDRIIALRPYEPVIWFGVAVVFVGIAGLAAVASLRESRSIVLADVMKSE